MKLRQKLAMVLAATMIVTAVPVVTMASSTATTASKNVIQAAEGVLPSAVSLVIDDLKNVTNGVFYVELVNSKFTSSFTTSSIVSDERITGINKIGNVLEVSFTASNNNAIQFDFAPNTIELTGGEAAFKITDDSTNITDNAGVVFATTKDASAVVTTGSSKTIFEYGEVSDIIITEPYIGVFKAGEKVEIDLDTDEFVFETVGTLTGTYGADLADVDVNITDKGRTLTIEFKAGYASTGTKGAQIKLEGVKVAKKASVKTPTEGELTAQVYGDSVETKEITLAKVSNSGIVLSTKKDKVLEVKGGDTVKASDVELTIKESSAEFFRTRDRYTVELSDGAFFYHTAHATTDSVSVIAEMQRVVSGGTVTDVMFDGTSTRVIGFEFKPLANDSAVEKIVYGGTLNMKADIVADTEISMTVTASNLSDVEELVIMKAVRKVDIATTPIVVKAGLKGQKSGEIAITETAKGMLKAGQKIYIDLDGSLGAEFSAKPEVTVTGDIKVKDVKLVGGNRVELEIERASREASTITFTNFGVDTTRSIPEGTWNVDVHGPALVENTNNTKIALKDFFVVGTPNTEDISGVTKVVSTLSAGATTMVVNDETVELPAATYIKNGKMMAPLKAVAKAFGIKDSDIIWNSADKSVTVVSNGRTAYLQIGNKAASLNGVPYTLATPAEIANDSTFVPVGDLGRLLGLVVEWDNATKTATFSN